MPAQPKKMLIIAVLETLRKYTDEQHRLMQAPLLQLLEKDYGLKVDRKSLRHNIECLINAGYPLQYRRGWYYRHEFSRQDLQTLAVSAALDLSVSPELSSRLFDRLNRMLPVCQPRLFSEGDGPDSVAYKLYLLKQAIAAEQAVELELEEGTADAVPQKLESADGEIVLTAVVNGSVRQLPLSGVMSVLPASGANA